ncbi:hypothetical protein [Nostoc sp.]|uniref:hypothetical protein n=1 Tax=Nostoc sp. TaxID=1180 RepID=UPI002FF7D7E4
MASELEGSGEWGVGSREQGDKGTKGQRDNPCPIPNAQCPMPNAQCPMPNAPFPIPNAPFPIPNFLNYVV